MTNLHDRIAACTICEKHLPHGVRPIVQFSPSSKILIIGQAPGSKVHASGIPWDDDSGDRLRDWTGLSKDQFYDPDNVAIVPMGFCYPGKASGGDKPPRKECAPEWHQEILSELPEGRLTLLIGTYAQAYYLPEMRKMTLTERVKAHEILAPDIIALPHPAWRSRIWMGKNPWFAEDVLPMLRDRIGRLLN